MATSEEIVQAMRECYSVMYKDVEYERISAYVLRAKKLHNGKIKVYKEVEIVDANCKNCVLAVSPGEVEIIDD